jgi:hypothetical protein
MSVDKKVMSAAKQAFSGEGQAITLSPWSTTVVVILNQLSEFRST